MIHKELTYKINGAMFRVHNEIGNTWTEEMYEKALEAELRHQGLNAERQKKFEVFYFDRSVGNYRTDLLVENTVIVELKTVPELLPLHRAQLISYLKGYDKPVGILANFRSVSLQHQTVPNNLNIRNAESLFDYEKVTIKDKERIKDLLFMADRILTTLGSGYFHQIYRRAFRYELEIAVADFRRIKEFNVRYRGTVVGTAEVNFFVIGDLLLSAVAVSELNRLILSKLRNYMKQLNCRRGLIFNFNATVLDFRYIEL